MEKVLITGASGFIGKGILEQIIKENKYEIYAITTSKKKLSEFNNINIIEANLHNRQDIEQIMKSIRPNKMIHLAWKLEGNDAFQKNGSNLEWVNISINIIMEFVKYGGKRIIFAGSSSEYDFTEQKISENYLGNTINFYGSCKKSITSLASEYCEMNDVEFVTARFFSVYGKYDDREGRAIPTAIKKIINGEPITCKAPNNIWDYIYIEDAANIVIKLLESNYCGIMNIASGNEYKMKTVFETIGDILNAKELILFENENEHGVMLVADVNNMKDVLHYKCKYSLREGLEKTIEWYKNI